MNYLSKRSLETHLPVVAWLLILGHAILLVAAALLWTLLTGIGVTTGDQTALSIMSLSGAVVSTTLVVLGLPNRARGAASTGCRGSRRECRCS